MLSEARQKIIMEKLNRAQKCSKPRVKGGPRPQGPPGSSPVYNDVIVKWVQHPMHDDDVVL